MRPNRPVIPRLCWQCHRSMTKPKDIEGRICGRCRQRNKKFGLTAPTSDGGPILTSNGKAI